MLTIQLSLAAAAVAKPEDAAATAVICNAGATTAQIDLTQLTSPSLALEITDETGKLLRLPPPPTPGRSHVVALGPGERRSFAFRSFLPAGTPAGRYRLRVRYAGASSEIATVRVSG